MCCILRNPKRVVVLRSEKGSMALRQRWGFPCDKASAMTLLHSFLRCHPWRTAALGFLLLTSFGIRLYRIWEPPMEFHPIRQYRSAVIARGYFLSSSRGIPEWRARVAAISKQREGVLEPPLLELAASALYRVAGGEALWLPRVVSSLSWLIGAALLYAIARRLFRGDAAVVCVAFYLLLPFGVLASRSFQPDAAMVMLLMASLLLILRYHLRPSRAGLLVAMGCAGLSGLVKPICLLPILGSYLAVAVWKRGLRGALLGPALPAFVAVSLLPGAVFYLRGMAGGGALLAQAHGSFVPQLFLEPAFWRGWLSQAGRVVSYPVLACAVLGLVLSPRGLPRSLLVGLWAGYLAVGIVFPYHMSTHDYYHLQLIPIIALCLGSLAALVGRQRFSPRGLLAARLAAGLALALAAALSLRALQVRVAACDSAALVHRAQEIGTIVGHTTESILLDRDYGKAVAYHGEFSGLPWPHWYEISSSLEQGRQEPPAAQRLRNLIADIGADYFIVTDPGEMELQRDLRDLLRTCPVLARGEHYVIFDLRGSVWAGQSGWCTSQEASGPCSRPIPYPDDGHPRTPIEASAQGETGPLLAAIEGAELVTVGQFLRLLPAVFGLSDRIPCWLPREALLSGLRRAGLIDRSIGVQYDAPLTRGRAAVLIARPVLEPKSSLTERLMIRLSWSETAAFRVAVRERLLPAGSPGDYVTGKELGAALLATTVVARQRPTPGADVQAIDRFAKAMVDQVVALDEVKDILGGADTGPLQAMIAL